jgi:RNA polymerase sigma-70 factor (ECF subfamily)
MTRKVFRTNTIGTAGPKGSWLLGFRQPVTGRERTVALLFRFPQLAPGAAITTLLLNGSLAARIDAGERNMVVTFVIEDGRIARLYGILNPHKLRRLEKVAELRR